MNMVMEVGSLKGGELLDQLGDYQLLKRTAIH
jgi:hypothetical protein